LFVRLVGLTDRLFSWKEAELGSGRRLLCPERSDEETGYGNVSDKLGQCLHIFFTVTLRVSSPSP
jgi:hypothetical protein